MTKAKYKVTRVVLRSSAKKIFVDVESISEANNALYFVWKRGKHSDVYYEIHFADDHVLNGSIDLEPKEFHKEHQKNFLSWHLNTFWNNVAKSKASYLSADDKKYAQHLVENYELYKTGGKVTSKKNIVVTDIEKIPNFHAQLEAGKVTYRGLGIGKLADDFYKLAEQNGTLIKVEGKEYFVTDTDFNKYAWDDVKKEWKRNIPFSAPARKYEKGGEIKTENTFCYSIGGL